MQELEAEKKANRDVERYDDGMPENVNKWDLLEAREKG
jgi:hypothetical protein